MNKTLYSIGYAGYQIEDFINELKANEIGVLIDVRSTPYSSHFSEYNRDNLEKRLNCNRIHYRNYANEFGARQPDPSFYSPEGYLDFEKFTSSTVFNSGVKKIEEGMKQNFVFAFMCAEKDPINCHRSIMVTRPLSEKGYTIIHLIPRSKPISQQVIENRLLEEYYPERSQIGLFDNNINENELIQKAYRKKNAEIGFRLKEEITV